jgi:hypothetical protein
MEGGGLALPFADSLVCLEALLLPPRPSPQNESTGAAESGRGTGLRVEGFQPFSGGPRATAAVPAVWRLRPSDPAAGSTAIQSIASVFCACSAA